MLAVLAGCGGGEDDGAIPAAPDCSTAGQNRWLRDYMAEWYFWYALTPRPAPGPGETLDSYFNALLFTGNQRFPADRYSYYQSTESFDRFYGPGETLGYGLSVAGLEVSGRPDLPLRVRYVEPQSDAAAQGLVRGMEVLAVNGRSAAELIADDDYGALVPARAGDTLQLVLRDGAGQRAVTLTAEVFALTPAFGVSAITTPQGRRVGYLQVKDMIDPAVPIVDQLAAQFRDRGVQELALDLRYNGGGRVAVGATVASYIGGRLTNGQDYARLLYNDRRAAAYNQVFRFEDPAAALSMRRVYVLVGPRTCSAAEQVINGLRPFVDVVLIGDTTCGKPVGFLPAEPTDVTGQACGTTFNVVNFESVNARQEGRYFEGLTPTCAVADDLDHSLGSPDEALLAAALVHADTGACPSSRAPTAHPLGARALGTPHRSPPRAEPGERQGMVVD